MTDHKFTDDDVIKALQCLSGAEIFCRECAFGRLEDHGFACKKNVANAALALINRQKAEIESLNAVHADMIESLRLAAEANKDMTAELQALRGAANSYKMHYETAIKELATDNTNLFVEAMDKIKTEAIKEFAERLKANMSNIARMEYGGNTYFCVGYDLIDTLVKEITEVTPE